MEVVLRWMKGNDRVNIKCERQEMISYFNLTY